MASSLLRPSRLDTSRANSPLAEPEDPLLAAEEQLGLHFVPKKIILPLPPSQKPAGPVSAKRPFDSTFSEGPLSRAKRPKAVKFSPSKGKRPARIVAASGSAVLYSGTPVLNNDFCDCCGGKGHFLCCDGCPRSFHFNCLDPPLELDAIPLDSWYCKICEANRSPFRAPKSQAQNSFFSHLIRQVELRSPRQFALTPDIKSSFQELSTTELGEFKDISDLKSVKTNSKTGFIELSDPYRLKDKNGAFIICFRCARPPSIALHKQIAGCDYCENHWHLDCLEPPLVVQPPRSKKWMCPLHSDLDTPKTKKPKPQPIVIVSDRNVPNNGNISIKSRPAVTKAEPDWEEIVLNGLRYQVPEETVILDFWAKVRNEPRPPPPNWKLELAKQLGVSTKEKSSGYQSDSSLSSLSSSPDTASDTDGVAPANTSRPIPREVIQTSLQTALPSSDRIPSPNGYSSENISDGKTRLPSPLTSLNDSDSASEQPRKKAKRQRKYKDTVKLATAVSVSPSRPQTHSNITPTIPNSPLKLRLTFNKPSLKGKERAVEPPQPEISISYSAGLPSTSNSQNSNSVSTRDLLPPALLSAPLPNVRRSGRPARQTNGTTSRRDDRPIPLVVPSSTTQSSPASNKLPISNGTGAHKTTLPSSSSSALPPAIGIMQHRPSVSVPKSINIPTNASIDRPASISRTPKTATRTQLQPVVMVPVLQDLKPSVSPSRAGAIPSSPHMNTSLNGESVVLSSSAEVPPRNVTEFGVEGVAPSKPFHKPSNKELATTPSSAEAEPKQPLSKPLPPGLAAEEPIPGLHFINPHSSSWLDADMSDPKPLFSEQTVDSISNGHYPSRRTAQGAVDLLDSLDVAVASGSDMDMDEE